MSLQTLDGTSYPLFSHSNFSPLRIVTTMRCNNYAIQPLCNASSMHNKHCALQGTMQCLPGQLSTASTMQCKHYAVLLWATMQCNHCKHYDYACCLQATMHHNCFPCDTYSLEMHVLYNLEKITKITHMYVV